MSGIAFALNYPTEFELVRYDSYKKKYIVTYLDGGWYTIDLTEKFVRSCMTTLGPKAWVEPPTTRYEDIFNENV
jgi:hypothetical protein